MHKGRLEAFSDGVIAIIITIMVLELEVPHAHDHAARFADLVPLLPVFLSYALSFLYLAIYWNNHHHMLQTVHHTTGKILWANLHLLFWLSLIPFATGWLGENHFEAAPASLYGFILLMCALAYWILERTILHAPGGNALLEKALAKKIKELASTVLYAAAIPLAFVSPWISCAIYFGVALLWLIPDPRIERVLAAGDGASR